MSHCFPPKKAVVQQVPTQHRIGNGEISFSFEYFFQRDFYGLSEVNIKWFINFLESLKDYSSRKVSEIEKNSNLLNCHALIYKEDNPKSTLGRNDFPHLAHILSSDQIELHQIKVSDIQGRLIFFTYGYIIYIVLIDPHHNAYLPDSHPELTQCYKLEKLDAYSHTVHLLEDFCSRNCNEHQCEHVNELLSLTKGLNETRIRTAPLRCVIVQNSKLIKDIDEITQTYTVTLNDIIENGILYYLDKSTD